MKKSIVFIHGFLGYGLEKFFLIEALRRKGYDCHVFSYYKKIVGIDNVENIANDFDAFVNENVKGDFVVVGLSLGGIIATYWLEFLNGKKKCRTCVSACSPFYGTPVAYLVPTKGARELRPGSEILKKIVEKAEKSKVGYHSLWTPLDLIVIPGENALLKNAVEFKTFYLTHGSVLWGRKIRNLVEELACANR